MNSLAFVNIGSYIPYLPCSLSGIRATHTRRFLLITSTTMRLTENVLGDKDFIPELKTERFNPAEWVELFHEQGHATPWRLLSTEF